MNSNVGGGRRRDDANFDRSRSRDRPPRNNNEQANFEHGRKDRNIKADGRPSSSNRSLTRSPRRRSDSTHSGNRKTDHHHGEKDGKSERRPRKKDSDSSKDQRSSSSSSKSKQKEKGKPDKEDEKRKAVGVLDVDWNELPSKKPEETVATANGDQEAGVEGEEESSSVLKRFTPANVLLQMGISTRLLPSSVVDKVKDICNKETGKNDSLPLVTDQQLGALNRAESQRQKSWKDSFQKSLKTRLTSYDDVAVRENILGISQDSTTTYQPPQIINSRTYSASLKHYLSCQVKQPLPVQ